MDKSNDERNHLFFNLTFFLVNAHYSAFSPYIENNKEGEKKKNRNARSREWKKRSDIQKIRIRKRSELKEEEFKRVNKQ